MDHREKSPEKLLQFFKRVDRNLASDRLASRSNVFASLAERFSNELKNLSFGDALAKTQNILGAIVDRNPTFSATVPILLERFDTQKPELIGSGVLLRIANRVFLLTAAHVTDRKREGTFLIPGQEEFIPVNGHHSWLSEPASGRRADDKFDVAYVCLDHDCVSNLSSSYPILERKDVLLEVPLKCSDYSFAGFPWRKSRVKRNTIKTGFVTLFGPEVNQDEYETLGLNQSQHIAIRFHRQRIFHEKTRKVIKAPLPHGMSGGGVFAWNEEALKSWPVRLPFVGIANTYVPEKSLLKATRLHVFIRFIAHTHPNLVNLPTGQNLKSKLAARIEC